ncbi:hypothetical protein MYAM1_000753 [Malassezia yamatoensis]|uniref:DUF726-domain-containing protein n=1 Tax=Malassezia yamatoensis TaxID=253288 RepID=A0AAJ5YUU0_9BASI|nr:hypothetical protein MYAM1_000753 [Malassezia yamatoensis]
MLEGDADFEDEWEEMPIERSQNLESQDDSEEMEFGQNPSQLRAQRAHAARRQHLGNRGTLAHISSNNAGKHLEVHDVRGFDWRTRPDADESLEKPQDTEYTQLRLDEAEDEEELHAATEYLFQEDMNRIGDMDDDPTAAPISQLAMTKRLLTETQKIAYVGLCCITAYDMLRELQQLEPNEPKPASKSTGDWLLRVMVRLYQHLDIDVQEQTMIDSLAHHGILASDLARSLITTQTIANPGYDPESEVQQEPYKVQEASSKSRDSESFTPIQEKEVSPDSSAGKDSRPEIPVLTDPNSAAQIAEREATVPEHNSAQVVGASALQRTEPALPSSNNTLQGVTTEIRPDSKTITLDIRWTVLCDLFLVLTADSVYDARSRVLLERVADALQLTWMDLTKFEKRITDALEIEEDVQTLHDNKASENRRVLAQKKRMVMMGLATVGGGLVIGLSAGLLAPVIGAGIGAALGAVGISGTSAFLGGSVGAAAITTTGTLGGAALGGRGMSRRTRSVKTFEFRPMHNHKRVNCIVTVPGFLRGPEDDPTLPFGVIDPVMGDAFSIMWEPEMMREMGNAMSILWNETLVQGVQQVLAATVAGAMFSALAWPLWLTKLSYIIDNPWSNATERASAAGLILADVLMNRQLGVRPITLVGFSLGARMIYYALRELANRKAYGIVQNVYLLGAPVTGRESDWKKVRSVVSGRFVNAFSRSDWLLAYLHRATSGGLHSIAGLHPIEYDCKIENMDVTHIVPGHLSYRVLTPLVLGELGFKTTADYFDEPESLDQVPEREVVFDAKLEQPSTPRSKLSIKNMFFRKNAREERTAAALSAALRSTALETQAQSQEYDDNDLNPSQSQHTNMESTENFGIHNDASHGQQVTIEPEETAAARGRKGTEPISSERQDAEDVAASAPRDRSPHPPSPLAETQSNTPLFSEVVGGSSLASQAEETVENHILANETSSNVPSLQGAENVNEQSSRSDSQVPPVYDLQTKLSDTENRESSSSSQVDSPSYSDLAATVPLDTGVKESSVTNKTDDGNDPISTPRLDQHAVNDDDDDQLAQRSGKSPFTNSTTDTWKSSSLTIPPVTDESQPAIDIANVEAPNQRTKQLTEEWAVENPWG